MQFYFVLQCKEKKKFIKYNYSKNKDFNTKSEIAF